MIKSVHGIEQSASKKQRYDVKVDTSKVNIDDLVLMMEVVDSVTDVEKGQRVFEAGRFPGM